MRFSCGLSKEQKYNRQVSSEKARLRALKEWHPIFAWLPIRIGDKCIWLETIDRRYPWAGFYRASAMIPDSPAIQMYTTKWTNRKPEYRLPEDRNDSYES